MFQSTHPHGVRPVEILYVQGGERFQSTHPHGVRLLINLTAATQYKFQSTHPHGVRRGRIRVPTWGITGFNPRTHTGCDFILTLMSCIINGFNPRTHTGCDNMIGFNLTRLQVSIHAPTRGATRRVGGDNSNRKFQSTHPHGVRLGRTMMISILILFQSTHPHGVRPSAR